MTDNAQIATPPMTADIEALKAEVARCREALTKAEADLHDARCTIAGVRKGDVVWDEYRGKPALVASVAFSELPSSKAEVSRVIGRLRNKNGKWSEAETWVYGYRPLTDDERKEFGL
jgi:hypothetical protein